MIIDAHTHMTHPAFLTWMEDNLGAWGKERAARTREQSKARPSSHNVAVRLEYLDRYKIDFQVVTPGGGGGVAGNLPGDETATRMAIVRATNDGMARLMEDSKGRLIGVGTVPLKGFEKGGAQEMTRAVKSLGLKGITVPSHFEGRPLDVPELEDFWALAEQLDITVFVHPVSPAQHRDRPYEGDYDLSHNFGWLFESELALSHLVFSGIMDRYPKLKILSHHLGGGIPFILGRINETYDPTNSHTASLQESLHLTKSLNDYFAMFYYDTAIGGSSAAVRCAYDVFGADHLVFATDSPQGPGTGEVRLATYPGSIRTLGLPEADNKKIFADNARRILNLA